MKRITAATVAAVLFLIVLLALCLTKVRLHEVGVKVNMLGGGGIVGNDYAPGYYFVIPGAQKMYRLDPTVQAYQMGGTDRVADALKLRGKDQYTTRFDITILYRIKPHKAHLLADRVGIDPERIENFVRSKSEQVLWDVLGRLNTQDFYDVDKREAARHDATTKLQAILSPNNLDLVDILIREIEYDPKFEEILVQKQLLDQNKALNIEKTRLEKALEKTQSIERETEAKVKVIEEERLQEVANIVAETDAKVNQIEADADLKTQKILAEAEKYRRTRISAGELAKTQAQAKGEKAINEAYLGRGGQAYITRQLIDAIEFGDIEINTNKVNPFDVDQLLKMFGLDPAKLQAAAAESRTGG